MKGAGATAGDTGDSRVAMNVRVRVYPGTDGEVRGTVVEDFGDLACAVVIVGVRVLGHCPSLTRASAKAALMPAPDGVGRFVIRATRERGVGVPSSRSLATASREAT